MLRWQIPLIVCAACGDNLEAPAPDAPPPDSAAMPDAAPVCEKDVSSDEANCGACDHICHGGEVCKNAACGCPTGLIPPLVFPTGTEQFFGAGGFNIALAPTLSIGGVNGLLFGYDAGTPLDTDIDLSTVPLGTTPFVGSAAGLDIQNMSLDASYVATAGTLHFTKRCDTEIQGTLTNATFNGLSGGLLGGGVPMVDPEGCVIHVNALTFHLSTAACP
ncbi:MAG TPA: hypothetical protein VIV40_44485 [Kofleriaceae bacterium]